MTIGQLSAVLGIGFMIMILCVAMAIGLLKMSQLSK